MSAPSAANGAWRGTLRRVLRAVDSHVTSHTGSPTWRDHVLAEFRSGNRDTMALADRVAGAEPNGRRRVRWQWRLYAEQCSAPNERRRVRICGQLWVRLR